MNYQKREIHKNNLLLVGILLAVVACGDESDDSDPEEPDLYVVGDYLMNQCTVYYDDLRGWSECRDVKEWSLRPNQPVFTALNDCLTAKGHEQDNDPTVWDDSREDRDRGWAVLVVCSVVVDG